MKLDKARTALLVIDVLVTQGEDTLYTQDPAEQGLVEASVRVVDAARAAGLPVIFCCDQHIPGLDRELDLWGNHGIKDLAIPNPALRAGSGRRDFIIPKRRYSGFFQTDLDLTLRELDVDTLIAVGEDTNICVLHTLADAYFLGYRTIVVEDATRTFLCGTQETGIEHVRTCFGSTITTVEELVTALA